MARRPTAAAPAPSATVAAAMRLERLAFMVLSFDWLRPSAAFIGRSDAKRRFPHFSETRLESTTPREPELAGCRFKQVVALDQMSNRSLFTTFTHAATKSLTNFSWLPSWAYTSAMARSTECEPNTRSLAVAVHLVLPDARSTPS